MKESVQHEKWMRAAIVEAAKANPRRAQPNPRVGAVIVEDARLVASGRFEKDGEAHAEKKALQALKRRPSEEAVLYVTLEPCSTKGRTGACTDAIIKSGLKQVVVGALDPTLAHRGRGLEVLRAAGVDVISGVLENECSALNPGYAGHTTGRS